MFIINQKKSKEQKCRWDWGYIGGLIENINVQYLPPNRHWKTKNQIKCDYMNCLLKIRVVEKETLEMTTILIKDIIMCLSHVVSDFLLESWEFGEFELKYNKEIA